MSYVQVSLLKQHLAIVHNDDDAYLAQCLDAAEAHCASYMNRAVIADPQDYPWTSEGISASSSSESGSVVPASVVQAILMYAAEFYEQRLVGVTGTIYTRTKTADMLLDSYRILHGV